MGYVSFRPSALPEAVPVAEHLDLQCCECPAVHVPGSLSWGFDCPRQLFTDFESPDTRDAGGRPLRVLHPERLRE